MSNQKKYLKINKDENVHRYAVRGEKWERIESKRDRNREKKWFAEIHSKRGKEREGEPVEEYTKWWHKLLHKKVN